MRTDRRRDGRTDRQADMKLVVAFRNFEKAPNVRNGLFAIFHGALKCPSPTTMNFAAESVAVFVSLQLQFPVYLFS
jgi:hypothetical protein